MICLNLGLPQSSLKWNGTLKNFKKVLQGESERSRTISVLGLTFLANYCFRHFSPSCVHFRYQSLFGGKGVWRQVCMEVSCRRAKFNCSLSLTSFVLYTGLPPSGLHLGYCRCKYTSASFPWWHCNWFLPICHDVCLISALFITFFAACTKDDVLASCHGI